MSDAQGRLWERERDGEFLPLGTPVRVPRAVLQPQVCSPPSTFHLTEDLVSSTPDPNHDVYPRWPLGAFCPSALPGWGLHADGRAAGSGRYKPNPANLIPAPATSEPTPGSVGVTVTTARGKSHTLGQDPCPGTFSLFLRLGDSPGAGGRRDLPN